MANMDSLKDTFDRFLITHDLHRIWRDGLFGWDEARFDRKRQEAWAAFRKLTDDGAVELQSGDHLDFLLRKACGLPVTNGLKFRRGARCGKHGHEPFAHVDGAAGRACRAHERKKRADERLREIMRRDRMREADECTGSRRDGQADPLPSEDSERPALDSVDPQ